MIEITRTALVAALVATFIPINAQQPTTFVRVGSQDEAVQGTASITTGIASLANPKQQIEVSRVKDGIIVKADSSVNVQVYNISGQLVATGMANHMIQVGNFRPLMVRADGITIKI